ncbi:outer membrane protein assembly factor BamD [Parvibaculum sp.]|uniref:outer membrane protein assembly factor BamD n=1 Tax=Parvibaculum sp. TaxID=2024848 RepID=UPI002731E767|nr:outer membrane protein assembly factor BamD [Parvibaculum sp.]MDP1626982.1 outer membrane protein assembly factor BamD [Parvibaculum sp.]MDP2149776.1 outer membrane protein assembly factor BamD [Parvibaculum sp.]MDP3328776.1 outer membrane protein assembly factor BamD [Parvibaculum sp.]
MSEARLPTRRRHASRGHASSFSFIRAALAGALALAVTGLAGCSSDDELPYEERPVEQIYNRAMDYMQEGKYNPAAKEFDEVERQHPYSEWARRSMLMGAYAHYKINEYDEAILGAQRFISLHPSNKDVPYAYYLIGLSYYERISDVGRDQKMTENALNSFYELTRRFPASEYSRDARLKIDLTLDHLAGKEMEIGRYYLNRHDYIAAINRFRIVIEKYQTTTHTPEALERLTEAYLALGIKTEAQTAAAILGYNFPGSDWYEDSYALLAGQGLEPVESKDSWISKAWNSVF